MSCSFYVYATQPFRNPQSASILNKAMTEAVQGMTDWVPTDTMDVTWIPLVEELSFNILPFKVDIELNYVDAGPEVEQYALSELISFRVYRALKQTGPFSDSRPGVFPKVAISHFYMGQYEPSQQETRPGNRACVRLNSSSFRRDRHKAPT